MKAFDVACDTSGNAHGVAELGYRAVGVYLRPDRCSPDMLRGLHSVGVQVWSIWEKGEPTRVEYFCSAQGSVDAQAAIQFAQQVQMPKGKPIFACVDYDAAVEDLRGPVLSYMTAFHSACRDEGYLAGVYGSGATCGAIISAGVAHYGYLAGSTGFDGYETFLPRAAIVQGDENATVLEWGADLDTVIDLGVLW